MMSSGPTLYGIVDPNGSPTGSNLVDLSGLNQGGVYDCSHLAFTAYLVSGAPAVVTVAGASLSSGNGMSAPGGTQENGGTVEPEPFTGVVENYLNVSGQAGEVLYIYDIQPPPPAGFDTANGDIVLLEYVADGVFYNIYPISGMVASSPGSIRLSGTAYYLYPPDGAPVGGQVKVTYIPAAVAASNSA